MGRRNVAISKSIVQAILRGDDLRPTSIPSRLWRAIRVFFTLYNLRLVRLRGDTFKDLRNQTWEISEDEYLSSFEKEDVLHPKGDMGYSGSTFFTTDDNKYIIKSIPRQFEHSFFRDDLLEPYVDHMKSHPSSLLVRITDFLGPLQTTLGGLFNFAPTYHLVMENLLSGQGPDSKWQTFDLKPMSYFFPERDIAGGRLASQATKSKLADEFNGKIRLSRENADFFFQQLEADTQLLAQFNAVDYSLMLVRIPNPDLPSHPQPPATESNPFADPAPETWRTGIRSADNQYAFRAIILDFFWAKHKVHAKAMTFLINAWNLIERQGPMSITTTSDEYRSRFLKMCEEIVEVVDEEGV